MKGTQARKAQKAVKKISKKAVKKIAKKTTKAKAKTRSMLGAAKKKLKNMRTKSSKALHNAKGRIHAAEADIVDYVKENPIKSVSAVALTALIAGFIARYKK